MLYDDWKIDSLRFRSWTIQKQNLRDTEERVVTGPFIGRWRNRGAYYERDLSADRVQGMHDVQRTPARNPIDILAANLGVKFNL